MSGNGFLLFLAAWPMAAALVSYLIGRVSKKGRDLFADGAVVLEFAAVLWLLASGLSSSGFLASEFR